MSNGGSKLHILFHLSVIFHCEKNHQKEATNQNNHKIKRGANLGEAKKNGSLKRFFESRSLRYGVCYSVSQSLVWHLN